MSSQSSAAVVADVEEGPTVKKALTEELLRDLMSDPQAWGESINKMNAALLNSASCRGSLPSLELYDKSCEDGRVGGNRERLAAQAQSIEEKLRYGALAFQLNGDFGRADQAETDAMELEHLRPHLFTGDDNGRDFAAAELEKRRQNVRF